MGAVPEEMEARRPRRGGKTLWIVLGAIVVAGVILGYGVVAGWFSSQPITLTGAGATFPYPLINKWSSVYVNLTGVHVNYQSLGSGAGIAQITQKTVDFAGTDAPLKPSERAAAPGLLHLPETIGAVTATYNLPGIATGLNLTGSVLGDIFLGRVTSWNNASIQALNPSVNLPNNPIVVVHRSDGSGTTFVWTSYLHLENSGWNSSLVGKSINWPVGVGKPGNAAVAGYVIQTSYAIGYVELAYTVQSAMTVAKIKNPANNFVLPSLANTTAAASTATSLPAPGGDWGNVSILNAPGANSYPISSLTYLLVYKELNVLGSSMTQTKAKALVEFIWWAVHDGQTYAPALIYASLPGSIVTLDEVGLRSITFNGQTLHT